MISTKYAINTTGRQL